MYERVTITKLLPADLVEVSCSSSACTMCKGAMFCNNKGRTFKAWNKNKLDLASGDSINLFLPPARTIVATLITFSLLSRTSEVIALRSLGISLHRVALPAIAGAS